MYETLLTKIARTTNLQESKIRHNPRKTRNVKISEQAILPIEEKK
jgi:hypothetical protein